LKNPKFAAQISSRTGEIAISLNYEPGSFEKQLISINITSYTPINSPNDTITLSYFTIEISFAFKKSFIAYEFGLPWQLYSESYLA
jgi:hypothetical protein